MNSHARDSWHPGELAVQARAGVIEKMANLGPRLIRDYLPDQHREFFARLPMVIAGTEDAYGNLWASPLFGNPGFIQSPTPELLTIDVSDYYLNTAFPHLRENKPVGLLGIDLETRRRNRLNGIVVKKDPHQVTIEVQQSFGNCPQYIQQRRLKAQSRKGKIRTEYVNNWSSELHAFIIGANTCFITSTYTSEHTGNCSGMDVSHRGGQPGCIGFDDHHRPIIHDYPGNSFFNTIGNLTVDSRAGLLFLDFSRGDAITLTMTAEVIWKTEDPTVCGDYDRVIRLSLNDGNIIRNALPYRWKPMTSTI